MRVVDDVTELIGRTPIVKLVRVIEPGMADVFVKLEWIGPGASVKDRIALAMIEDAEREGKLRPGDTIVEPTSGNTGVGLAMIAAAKGYRTILVMPDSMSVERRTLLQAFGADLVLTPGTLAMRGAIDRAQEIVDSDPERYFMPQQFTNPSNPRTHEKHTAMEILEQMDGLLDAFVVGVGTGGTLTGVGKVLREKLPDCRIVAVEPSGSAVLSGGTPGQHKIQGLGAGFVPAVLNVKLIDEIITVENEQAFQTARKLARTEGLLCGISTGANVYAAIKAAKALGPGKRVLTISPSNGERYLSTALFS